MAPADTDASKRLTDLLLAEIVATAADAIICIDAQQNITLFNESAERVFGWTATEVIGQPVDVLLPERFRAVHRKHVEQFRHAPERVHGMGDRAEIAGLRKNGEEFPAEAGIAKIQVGKSVVYSAVLRDITHRIELNARLEQALKARDDTVGVVAHDLRNPLAAIKMLAGALIGRAAQSAATAPLVEDLGLVRDAADQMDRLIQDLLDVTRLEAGRMEVNLQRTEIVSVIEAVLRTLRPIAQKAEIKLEVDAPSGIPPVMADANRIAQALANLVGNAIKFTKRGGAVTIRLEGADSGVRVAVADTGRGIPAEQLPHVFERHWQAPDSVIRAQGAGLGLPIAKGIVESHGGTLGVTSQVGRGSTFFFDLQAADADLVLRR